MPTSSTQSSSREIIQFLYEPPPRDVLLGGGTGRGLQRSVSKALRAVQSRADIADAKSLVAALNNATDPIKMKSLRDWVQRYIELFAKLSKESIELLTVNDVKEYTFVGQLNVRGPRDTWLLESWFSSLGNAILYDRHGEEKILCALECALLCVDKSAFKGNSAQLLRLSGSLLSKLDPKKTSFSRETYDTHRATLCALHQTFVAIQEVAPKSLNPNSSIGLYQRFKTRLQEIKEEQTHYPFVYLVELIRQSIQRLENGENIPTMSGALRRVFRGAWGALCVAEGIRGLAALEFRHDSFETGYANLREAFKKTRIEQKPWYDWIQALNRAALASIEDPENYVEFADCFDALGEKHSRVKKKEERVAIRFAMIDQLVVLVLQGADKAFHSSCLDKLLDLAERSECDGWAADAEVFEALLDALCTVHGSVERKQEIETGLEMMTTAFKTPAVQATCCGWLGGSSLEDKLSSMHVEQEDEKDRIFPMVVEQIQKGDLDVALEFCEELKVRYEASEFAEVRSFFENERAKHVESLQFSLVRYREVVKNEKRRQEDHSEEHHERKNMVRVPIRLNELFNRRKLVEDGPTKEIRVVLAVGNPGTGKTSISKKLAYLWAIGKWGKEFQTVYVLPVRRLSKTFYDGSSSRKAPILARAIANVLYAWREDEEYSALCKHIDAELKKSTTLLILDGLDEGADACEEIIHEAKRCACRLLMLSRPYNLHQERAVADFEVECLGLDDEQLSEFINKELPKQSSSRLVSYLKANPSIWSIAHVPVTANILCVLWKEESDTMSRDSKELSLLTLYKRMTWCVWKRYVKKYKMQNVNQTELFYILGKIAFAALKSGQILISQSLVNEHVSTGSMEKILKESGFLLLQLEGDQYQFPHFTFEEFFAGVHLATDLSKGTPREVAEAKHFISQNKYFGKYKVMLSFMAEEVRSVDGADGCKKLWSLIDQEPREVGGLQHLTLKVTILKAFFSAPIKHNELSAEEVLDSQELARMEEGVLEMFKVLDADFKHLAFEQMSALACATSHVSELQIGKLRDSVLDSHFSVRTSSVRQIPVLISAAPDQSEVLIEILLGFLFEGFVAAEDLYPQILFLLEVVPHFSTELMEKLTENLKSEDKYTRRDTLGHVPFVIKALPLHSDSLIGMVVEGLEDKHEFVRAVAVSLIPALIEIVPQHSAEFFEKLMESFADENMIVRSSAIQQIARLTSVMPQHSDTLRGKLMEGFKDTFFVRAAAVREISALIKVAPQLSDMLIKKLIESVKDKEKYVRQFAVEQIPSLIDIVPEYLDVLIESLVDALKDNDQEIRGTAVIQIPSLINIFPQRSDLLFKKLMEAFKDDDESVRMHTVIQFSALLDVAPQRSDALFEKLMEGFKDKHEYVRSHSMEQIPDLIKITPEHSAVLIGKLSEGFKDVNFNARVRAFDQVCRVVELIPDSLCGEVVKTLLSLLDEDENPGLVQRSLESIPVEKVLDYFWQCKDNRLIQCLAEGFLKHPFVVEYKQSTSNSAVLALKGYASDKKEWRRPIGETEALVQLINQEISDKHAAFSHRVWKPVDAEPSQQAEKETVTSPMPTQPAGNALMHSSFYFYSIVGCALCLSIIGLVVYRSALRK